MPISITPDQQARVFRRMLPAVLLSAVVILAVIAAVAFWLHDTDPQVEARLQYIRADQQQTTSRTEATNDGPAAESQFIVPSARLSTLQDAMTRILRDNAALVEQLKATQTRITQMARDNAALAEQLSATQTQITQMAQDKAVVTEQLKVVVTQMALNNASAAEKLEEGHEHIAGAFAKDSEESPRPQATLPRPIPAPAIPQRRQIVMRNWF